MLLFFREVGKINKYILFVALFFMFFGVLGGVKPAQAVTNVCDNVMWTNFEPIASNRCFAVPTGTVIFRPGTKAAPPGSVWWSVVGYPIPVSDVSTHLVFLTSFTDFNLGGVLPASSVITPRPPDPYGVTPFYGMGITQGWMPDSSVGDTPPLVFTSGTHVIAPPGGDPHGAEASGTGFSPRAFALKLTDPIVFLTTGEAIMVPIGTSIARPTGTVVWPDAGCPSSSMPPQPGCQTTSGTLLPLSMMGQGHPTVVMLPGDILIPPPGYVDGPWQDSGAYTYTPWTLQEIGHLTAPWGLTTLFTPPPPPPSAVLPLPCVPSIPPSGTDPCIQTAFNNLLPGLKFARDFEGGEQFQIFLNDWYNNEFEPAMKDMTEQLNVAAVDESRNIGSFYDAETQTKTQGLIQHEEVEANRRLRPSENMCAMATITTGMQTALQTTRAVKDAMNQEAASRALNLPGSGAEFGKHSYQEKRWDDYCTVSANTTDNAGASGCVGMGAIPGADINVERFLFRDTINMNNSNERTAASEILRNLVDPGSLEPLSPNFSSTNARRNKLLRDHYAAVRQPLVDVVSGVIARRTSIPSAQLGAGVGMSVQAIRTQAGIPIAETTTSPSYNEMMQARSKEYFFNVDKLLQAGADIGAVRQELVVNEALIAVTLQDIEELERQLNAVLMSQSTMKYNEAESRNTSMNMSSAPKP